MTKHKVYFKPIHTTLKHVPFQRETKAKSNGYENFEKN
jgi:hypothetical protein